VDPTLRVTESVEVGARLDLPDFRGQFPLLQRGFSPKDADVKVGPLYFKLRQLSLSLLATDNEELTEKDRDSELIGVVTLAGAAYAQITEGLRIATAGSLLWLPFDNQIGFVGFGLFAPYSFGLATTPTIKAQIEWSPSVFGIPVLVTNEFSIIYTPYSDGFGDTGEIYEGGDFSPLRDESSQRFGGIVSRNRSGSSEPFRNRQNEFGLRYYENEVRALVQSRVRGENLLTIQASHENFWADDDDDTSAVIADSRDRLLIALQSLRPNTRFRPYVSYLFSRSVNPDRENQVFRSGLAGPISDLVDFRGEFGVIYRDGEQANLLWNFRISHRVNSTTSYTLEYVRDLNEFENSLHEEFRHTFRKILGPDLTISGYFAIGRDDDQDDDLFDRTFQRYGLRLSYVASPRTTFRISGDYQPTKTKSGFGDLELFTASFEVTRRFSDRLSGRLTYQFRDVDSDLEGESYYENLILASLSLIFD
jgi:hypothetical protein